MTLKWVLRWVQNYVHTDFAIKISAGGCKSDVNPAHRGPQKNAARFPHRSTEFSPSKWLFTPWKSWNEPILSKGRKRLRQRSHGQKCGFAVTSGAVSWAGTTGIFKILWGPRFECPYAEMDWSWSDLGRWMSQCAGAESERAILETGLIDSMGRRCERL